MVKQDVGFTDTSLWFLGTWGVSAIRDWGSHLPAASMACINPGTLVPALLACPEPTEVAAQQSREPYLAQKCLVSGFPG